MKKIITKMISMLAIMLMLVNSSLMLVISIAVDTVKNIIDETKTNAIYELNIEKYVNYKMGEKQGTLVQANLRTGIEYQEGQEYAPIEETEVIINAPKINGKYPENIEIVTKSTKASNGDENGKDVNYTYSKDSGDLKIITQNKANDKGCIYTENVAGARDEYQINLYYDSDCYNGENQKRVLGFTGKEDLKIKNNENEVQISKDIQADFEVAENISGLISINVTTSDIYNGFINANVKNGTANDTEYAEYMSIQVGYKEIADEMYATLTNTLKNKNDKETETKDVVYKGLKLNKQNILDILGDDGNLQVLDNNGNKLTEVNKDTKSDDDGTIDVNYENEQNSVIVKTTKPVKIGDLKIENKKVLKSSMTDLNNDKIISKNTVKCINRVQKEIEQTHENEEKQTQEVIEEKYNFENTNEEQIKESKTRIDVNFNKTEWTNSAQNDTTITATLVTNGPEYNLFKNPVFEIQLPQEVEKVVLGETQLLYNDNLSIKKAEVIDKNNQKIIRVELNGTQNAYTSNSISNGVNVVIPATIIIKKDSESVQTNAYYEYSNETADEIDYEQEGKNCKNIGVNIIVPQQESVDTQEVKQGAQEVVSSNLDAEIIAKVGDQIIEDKGIVRQGEVITYTYKITNNTGNTVNGIKAVATIPNDTVYVTKDGSYIVGDDDNEYKGRNELFVEHEDIKNITENMESLKNGESHEFSFQVRVKNVATITETLAMSSEGKEETIIKKIAYAKKGKIRVEVFPAEKVIATDTENKVAFCVSVVNLGAEKINDAKVKIKLADEWNFYDIKEQPQYTYDEKTRILEFNTGEIVEKNEEADPKQSGEKSFYIEVAADNIKDGLLEKNIPFTAAAYMDDENGEEEEYRGNLEEYGAKYANITVTQKSVTEGEDLENDQEIEYNIEVKNTGKKEALINIIDNLPEELMPEEVTYESYILNDETDQYEKIQKTYDMSLKMGDDDFNVQTYIYPNDTLNAKIKAKVDRTDKFKNIENIVTVTGQFMQSKVSNGIKNRIVPYGYVKPDSDNPDNPDPDNPTPDNPNPDNPNPDNPNDPSDNKGTYSIKGIAWIDSDKNGQRDDGENVLEGITVKLFNAETNVIVTDKNNNAYKTITNNNGEYSFGNVVNGKYLVLFEYDTDKYELTAYQKDGISSNLNSDAILKEVNVDGQVKNVGVTDIVEINNANVSNIDIGLLEKGNFDLSVEKYISKVTVETEGKAKEYNYDNSKLAKVEIAAKKMSASNVKVEYKIIVKNNGNVEAYGTEIADAMPQGFEFDGNENSSWTVESKKAINKSLAGVKIKAGESKELTIVLTKDLSDGSIGTATNTVQISKSYNTSNFKDNNSDNDSSQAQLIISVKTGIAIKIGITLGIILVLIAIGMLIKNKKFDKNIAMMLSAAIIIGTIIAGSTNTFASLTAGPKTVTLTYDDLGGHKSISSGVWSVVHPGQPYWCTTPGGHLGSYVRGTWTEDGMTVHGQCSVKHIYTKTGTMKVYTSFDEFRNYLGSSASQARIFKDWFGSSGEASASGRKTKGPTDNKYEMKNGKLLVGPFQYTHSLTNAEVTGKSLSVKDGGKDISYTIFNSSKSGIIGVDDITSGTTFYLLVSTDVSNLSIQIKETVKLTTIEKKVGVEEYTLTGLAGDGICKNTSGEEIGHKYGSSISLPKNGQHLIRIVKSDKTTTRYDDLKYNWTWEVEKGKVTVSKKDADSGKGLTGATMQLTGGPSNYYSKTVKMTSPSYTFENLLPGNYILTEVGAPSGYKLELQTDKTKNLTVTANKTTSTSVSNKQYGNLKVQKVDKDTGKPIKAVGFKFKIYTTKGYITKYVKGNPSIVVFGAESSAQVFTTDSNGQFELDNLPLNPNTYYVKEVGVADSMKNYYEVKGTVDAFVVNNNVTSGTTYKNVANPQIWVDVQGYVWEDIANSDKKTTRNDIFNTGVDKLADGVIVRLKHRNGTVIDTKVTGKDGTYKFIKVKISELGNYYIEFEYNGLKYQCVNKNLSLANGSKAIEITSDRTNFNNSYSSITGGNAKESSTTGYSKSESGKITNNLTYKNGTYSSSLVANTSYATSSGNGYVTAQSGSVGIVMKSNTLTAGYTLKWSPGVYTISNVNLGMYQREQPDMAIATDLNNIELDMNGYMHTYKYNRRLAATGIDIFSEMQKWKNTADTKNYPRTYTRSIYNNYAYASGITGDGKLEDKNKLEVYLTYKIVVKNESSSLYMASNELVNYYDSTLDYVSSYYEDGSGRKVNISWDTKANKDGYKQMRTSGLKDLRIEPGRSVTVYVRMKKNSTLNWSNVEANSLHEKTYSITEVTSYSSYMKSGSSYVHYAGIDHDSAPDNIKVGDDKTYEDDTDSAPIVEITLDQPRTITGNVFEDYTSTKTNANSERKGTGKYDSSKDGTVQNVKVELINMLTNTTAYVYPNTVSKMNFTAKKAEMITGKDGKYEFVGIIPGKYYIKYTYGDGSVIYRPAGDGKLQEYAKVTTQDYKSTIVTNNIIKGAFGNNKFITSGNTIWYEKDVKGYSSAVDDYGTRKNINEKLSTITYSVRNGYEEKKDEYASLQKMTARTSDMDIAIENTNKEETKENENRTRLYDNINFGIVERPRKNIELTKEIKYLRLKLANGQTLIDGDPRNNSKIRYLTYPDGGLLKIELDSEMIEGATIEIQYAIMLTNNSELDYDTQAYYKYGDKTGATPVKMKINQVVDYLDENLSYIDTDAKTGGTGEHWEQVDPQSLYTGGYVSRDVYNNGIKTLRNVYVRTCDIETDPTKGHNTAELTFNASKLLSGSKDMTYQNYAEVLKVSNSVGRFYGQVDRGDKRGWKNITPGNFNPKNPTETSETDDNQGHNPRRAEVVIVPPTGENKNTVYIITGIGCMAVLAVGVVFIKNKVLHK